MHRQNNIFGYNPTVEIIRVAKFVTRAGSDYVTLRVNNYEYDLDVYRVEQLMMRGFLFDKIDVLNGRIIVVSNEEIARRKRLPCYGKDIKYKLQDRLDAIERNLYNNGGMNEDLRQKIFSNKSNIWGNSDYIFTERDLHELHDKFIFALVDSRRIGEWLGHTVKVGNLEILEFDDNYDCNSYGDYIKIPHDADDDFDYEYEDDADYDEDDGYDDDDEDDGDRILNDDDDDDGKDNDNDDYDDDEDNYDEYPNNYLPLSGAYSFSIKAKELKFTFIILNNKLIVIADIIHTYYYNFKDLGCNLDRIVEIILFYIDTMLLGKGTLKGGNNLGSVSSDLEYESPIGHIYYGFETSYGDDLGTNEGGKTNCISPTALFINGFVFPLQYITAQCDPDEANIIEISTRSNHITLSDFLYKALEFDMEDKEDLRELYKILINSEDKDYCIERIDNASIVWADDTWVPSIYAIKIAVKYTYLSNRYKTFDFKHKWG